MSKNFWVSSCTSQTFRFITTLTQTKYSLGYFLDDLKTGSGFVILSYTALIVLYYYVDEIRNRI